MKRWQYLILDLRPSEAGEQLDHFGKDGWELIALQGTRFYLKKEVKVSAKSKKSKG